MTIPAQSGGVVQSWPLPRATQAVAISNAMAAWGIPAQVFLGMYNNETNLGFLRNADGSIQTSPTGAVGPFQMEPTTAAQYNYPLTSTPNTTEFAQQADGAAHYLHDIYVDFVPTAKNWRNTLAGYNAGQGNYRLPAAQDYGSRALAFNIPAVWKAELSGNFASGIDPATPGGTAGAGGTGTLINDSSGFRVGDPTNPDEDFWTAINRLCQERYWYECDIRTQVPTPDGWTTIGNLEVGDFVLGTNGRPVQVLGLLPIHIGRDCFRLIFRDGTSVITDADHPWTTTRGTFSTREISNSVTTRRKGSKYPYYNHRIMAAAPLNLDEADLPIDPYVFGYWLGDGTARYPRITVAERDRSHVISEISRAGLIVHREWQDGCAPASRIQVANSRGQKYGGLANLLRRLGVTGNKRIPLSYLRASHEQRLALLQGLMDSDGWICNKSCVISQVNERLADDVLELLRTLGLQPARGVRKYRRPVRNPQGGLSVARDQITIRFAMPDFCPFRLPRKAEQYQLIRSRLHFQRDRYHTIVAVEQVPSEPVRCITVDSPDHLFLVGESMVPTHNCFSDGETLYIADGPDLMKQTPAMELDRVADAGIIAHLEFSFDNTAWTYAATHKKRRRAQRRTALAKITSPVEGLCEVVCKIDEVRAGDVAKFFNAGPGDGQWLVGDCRRSVFSVTSEITVVPALTPLAEGQLDPAGQNKNNSSIFATTVSDKGYVNPVGQWSPSRVDQGVDGTLTGPLLAPGDTQILFAIPNDPGWLGGYIVGKLLNGSLAGKYWYAAEGIAPLIPNGATVKAGTPVGRPVQSGYPNSPGTIEIGWADPNSPRRPLAQSLSGYSGDQSPQALAAGNSFNRFLIKLGASPGSVQGHGVGVVPAPMPPGYP